MTAPEAKIQNRASTVDFCSVASTSTSRPPPRKYERDDEGQSDCERVATFGPDRKGLEWTAVNDQREQESKAAKEILDTIDAQILRAARLKGGARQQLKVNRDRIAELLGTQENWKRPDDVYADEAWEICVVWRSEFGKVEIGTEEDGTVSYFVSRTLSEKSHEGIIEGCDADKLKKILSWLESDQVDIESR